MSKVYSNVRSFSQSLGRAATCLIALFICAAGAGAGAVATPDREKITPNTRTAGDRGSDALFRVHEYNVFEAPAVYKTSTTRNNSSLIGSLFATTTVAEVQNDSTQNITQSGYYRITVRGGDGGSGTYASGGSGATVGATFLLQAGDVLTRVTGAVGDNGQFSSSGGGGS